MSNQVVNFLLDNVLVRNFDDFKIRPGDVKLADFGLCKDLCVPYCNLQLQCGTRSYMAPEVLKGIPYSYEVDLFPLSIITFILLTGEHPFLMQDHKLDPSLDINEKRNIVSLNRIRYADWRWDECSVSAAARDFIESIGCEFPEKRKPLAELLTHTFITREVRIIKSTTINTVKGAFSESTTDGTVSGEVKQISNQVENQDSETDWLKELKHENRLLKLELKLRLNPTLIDHDEEDLLPVDPRESYSVRPALKHIFQVLTYSSFI